MEKRELEQHLRERGCQFLREGAAHSIWVNPQTGRKETIPRHNEIKRHLAEDLPLSPGGSSKGSLNRERFRHTQICERVDKSRCKFIRPNWPKKVGQTTNPPKIAPGRTPLPRPTRILTALFAGASQCSKSVRAGFGTPQLTFPLRVKRKVPVGFGGEPCAIADPAGFFFQPLSGKAGSKSREFPGDFSRLRACRGVARFGGRISG
jgi:mRNA interferase HicA